MAGSTSSLIYTWIRALSKENVWEDQKGEVVETTILSIKQALPVKLEKFWGSSSNKMQLEQIFIEWISDIYNGDKPVYLGAANKENIVTFMKILSGSSQECPSLKCYHEETNDRILFHTTISSMLNILRK